MWVPVIHSLTCPRPLRLSFREIQLLCTTARMEAGSILKIFRVPLNTGSLSVRQPAISVIFDGGTNAWQFVDAAYLDICGFIFEHQSGNGLNFDDGGTYATPAHHLIFERCTFRDMNASGNNDLLKLSGLDSFTVKNCLFMNGSAGGSGIDMVGCHDGDILGCRFENMGANAIQAKGGARNIRIEANLFKNCGDRSLNLGGSTGLQFFRPPDAPYEAADLHVYSNIFIGSTAPVAYVGCIQTDVVNNTIYLPDKWVLRILQETVDTTRFFPCSNNTFRNNLIVIDNAVNVVCNIGPNTKPETFTFSNNLWFHQQQPGWTGPALPAEDSDNIVGEDPLLADPLSEDFTPDILSPAMGNGFPVFDPESDFFRNTFNLPRSIGAIEVRVASGMDGQLQGMAPHLLIYPNPAHESAYIECRDCPNAIELDLMTTDGIPVLYSGKVLRERYGCRMSLDNIPPGMYILYARGSGILQAYQIVVE